MAKICQLMLFLVRKQAAHLEKPVLDVAMPWFLQAIADSGDLALLDVLQALEAVICYSNNDIKEVSLKIAEGCKKSETQIGYNCSRLFKTILHR